MEVYPLFSHSIPSKGNRFFLPAWGQKGKLTFTFIVTANPH
jgi:hypothetical protein